MTNKLLLLFIFTSLILITSCSKDNQGILIPSELSDYELEVVDYFKDIALGFEFGNASKITRN